MEKYFCFEGKLYAKGTIVKIRDEHVEKFKFHLNLVFEVYNESNDTYRFRTLYNTWDVFDIPAKHANKYIESVLVAYIADTTKLSNKIEPKYIEGIISAWIWYILIMFFGVLLKGAVTTIIVWTLASIIFFNWRRKKINGE